MEQIQDYRDKSDEELVALALKQSDFFAQIVKRYEAKLTAYLKRLFNLNREDIEDILQEAFVKVYLNLNEFDGDLKFSSWIYRIAHNQAISSWRKVKARGFSISLDENDWQELTAEIDVADEVSRGLDRQLIAEALARLPLKYREVLILKFLEEKNYKEISDILKKPAGTIATLINRGKKLLAEELKHHYGTD